MNNFQRCPLRRRNTVISKIQQQMSADKINVYATVNTGFGVGVSAQRADTRVSAQRLITEARRPIVHDRGTEQQWGA